MSLLSKIWTSVRGGATEAGEAIVDSQSIRIMEQELRDADKDLNAARAGLGSIVGQVTGLKREAADYQEKIDNHMDYAGQALDAGDDALAEEIAEKIAEYEEELAVRTSAIEVSDKQANLMKDQIRQNERAIAKLKREKDMIKTTEKVQSAQKAVAGKFSGANSSLRSATESLERKRKAQIELGDRMQADQDLQNEEGGADLAAKMAKAGIGDAKKSSKDVLDRLRAKKKA